MSEDKANRAPDNLYEMRARASAGLGEIGLRKRHKIDKLYRISAAAQKLFARDGYDSTSLREIAREAGVALGTLSLYARDKRDLTLMIFNNVIPPLLEQGVRNARCSKTILTNLVAFFEPFYLAYARNVILYRVILGQIYSGPSSVHAEENNAIRAGLIDRLAEIIGCGVTSGECVLSVNLQLHARSFYYLYFAAVRVWLGQEAPKPDEGLAELQALFAQHAMGIMAT